jgi:glucokinase
MIVPVLEVGGTHVSSANVDTTTWRLVAPSTRLRIAPDGSADAIMATFLLAATACTSAAGAVWGVAMPDPFDYERGIARFEDVGKFESLYGVDVRAGLLDGIAPRPSTIGFINDADAFALGEWLNGAATGAVRCAAITLGTGVGSGWIADGHIVDTGPDLPPGGRAHRLHADGRPLEDMMSRRAIRRAYGELTGDTGADVAEICGLARDGDAVALEVLGRALRTLGAVLADPITRFGAEVVVVGGSMAGSWDVLESLFIEGFSSVATPPRIAVAVDADRAPLLGAARRALELS